MRSGARRAGSSASAITRSRPMRCTASSGNTSSPPAMPTSCDTHWMALIIGSSHSSK
jgi:hypothetical protein